MSEHDKERGSNRSESTLRILQCVAVAIVRAPPIDRPRLETRRNLKSQSKMKG